MKNLITTALCGACLFGLSSVAAVAATQVVPINISAGDTIIIGAVAPFTEDPFVLNPNESFEFIFDVIGDLSISDIALTGSSSSATDLGLVSFGFDASTPFTFDAIDPAADPAQATGSLGGASFLNGEPFSLFFALGDASAPVEFSAILSASEFVAPVPLPATLPLALAGFGLMGFVARRRKQAA